MRIIFLNCWEGKIENKFLDFVKSYKESTDIFAFIESSSEINNKLKSVLENFHFVESHEKISPDLWFDISIFINNKIKQFQYKVDLIKDKTGGDCVLVNSTEFDMLVVHGTPMPGDKQDTPIRLNFSRKIINIAKNGAKPIIIGGDFNLMPDTKSIRGLTEAGFVNLIKKFNIKTTRNRLAWDFYKNEPGFIKQYFADYCFVSKNIKVKSFEVPEVEVSDHLPLILDFEV